MCASALAAPPTVTSLNLEELKALVERVGYHVAMEEGAGFLHVTDGTSWPLRLGLAACEPDRRCQVIRAYTRFTIGESDGADAALKDFSESYSATVIQLVSAGEKAAEVGRDIALSKGRTDAELKGEIDGAVQDALRLRLKLMASDPRLKRELDR